MIINSGMQSDNETVVARAVFNTDAASKLLLFCAEYWGKREYRTFNQWYCRIQWYKGKPYCMDKVQLT